MNIRLIKNILFVVCIVLIGFLIKDCSFVKGIGEWAKGCAVIETTNDTSKYKFEKDSSYIIDSLQKIIREQTITMEIMVANSKKGIAHSYKEDKEFGMYPNRWYVQNQIIEREDGGVYRIDSATINNINRTIDPIYISASAVKKDTVIKDSIITRTKIEYKYVERKDSINIKNTTVIKTRQLFEITLDANTQNAIDVMNSPFRFGIKPKINISGGTIYAKGFIDVGLKIFPKYGVEVGIEVKIL